MNFVGGAKWIDEKKCFFLHFGRARDEKEITKTRPATSVVRHRGEFHLGFCFSHDQRLHVLIPLWSLRDCVVDACENTPSVVQGSHKMSFAWGQYGSCGKSCFTTWFMTNNNSKSECFHARAASFGV
jgi:hypothetical protein